MIDNPDVLKAQAKQTGNKILNAIKWLISLVPPLHPAGVPFVIGFAVVGALLAFIWDDFFWIGLILTGWCAFFFRNPDRVTPDSSHLVIAPADGLVSLIETVPLPSEFETEDDSLYTRISIFLNVFDVHVQRVPVSGTVKEVVYRPGKFMNAVLDKASEENERSSVLMTTSEGRKVAFVQIAGLIARRIINDLKNDQVVLAGQRYGLIRFGSRVDVYLPAGVTPTVFVGQRTIGGETILADFNAVTTTPVMGVVR